MRAHEPGLSGTRACKNVRWLRANAPHVFKGEEPGDGWGSVIPVSVRGTLNRRLPSEAEAGLLDVAALREVQFPPISRLLLGELFSGTLFFAQIKFEVAGSAPVRVADADIQTAIAWATVAAPQISAYCTQYGANHISVHQQPLQFTVSLAAAKFTENDVDDWVNGIAAQFGLAEGNSCVVILNPVELDNTDYSRADHVWGYHAHSATPYCFVNLAGAGLTVDDRGWLYANSLSHEVAEMCVDPHGDDRNPEVCDPCAGNCDNLWLCFFDGTGTFLGADQHVVATPYAFFTAAIVAPASSGACPAPQSDCAYPPPGWQAWVPIGVETFSRPAWIAALGRDTNSLDLFAVSPDGLVDSAWWRGQGWEGWSQIGSGTFIQGTPVAALGHRVGVDLFAVGEDGHVYSAWWRGQGWEGWSQIGSGSFSQATAIAAVARGDDLDLFAVGENGQVYSAWWRGQGWQGFAAIATGTFAQGTRIAAVARGGDIDVFAIGEDQRVYTAWWRGQSWQGFAPIGTGTFAGRAVCAIARDSAKLDVFAVGGDGLVYSAWWRGQGWEGWSPIGALKFAQATPVAAVARGSDIVDLFAVSPDGLVYSAWWRGQSWEGWSPIRPPGTFDQGTPISAVARDTGHLDLFAVGQDGRAYTSGWPGR